MKKELTLQELQPMILEWANNKGLCKAENATKQRLKLVEECGELASAILRGNIDLQKDAIGDVFVVLTILAEQTNCVLDLDFENEEATDSDDVYDYLAFIVYVTSTVSNEICNLFHVCNILNLNIVECANLAWNEIKDRTGRTVDGTFIKD